MVDSTTAENNETKVDIQAMLRRAEMIEMQLQMEARFKRNMAAEMLRTFDSIAHKVISPLPHRFA